MDLWQTEIDCVSTWNGNDGECFYSQDPKISDTQFVVFALGPHRVQSSSQKFGDYYKFITNSQILPYFIDLLFTLTELLVCCLLVIPPLSLRTVGDIVSTLWNSPSLDLRSVDIVDAFTFKRPICASLLWSTPTCCRCGFPSTCTPLPH